jgi:hypothetical protein
MAINPRAQKNHDELLPNYESKLAISDPELIEVFDNFAFDEVLSHGTLDKRTRLMVQLSAIIASHAVREYPMSSQTGNISPRCDRPNFGDSATRSEYFWRSGREKCFSLDIPFNRTSHARRQESVPGITFA